MKPDLPEITAYIGLGSNLLSPISQIKSARIAVNAVGGLKELAFSNLYRSSPMGPQDQPDYVNAVMAVATSLSPVELLLTLQQIELVQGRVRGETRWCARTLDLDLLLYGDAVIDLPDLKVPHPGIADRPFVLHLLHEIAGNLKIPGQGQLDDLMKKCPTTGLCLINDHEQSP